MSLVTPAVAESLQRPPRFRVTPQKRFVEAFRRCFGHETYRPQVAVCRANNSSQAGSALDSRVRYVVQELVYPGRCRCQEAGRADASGAAGGACQSFAPIEDKFIYVLRLGQRRFVAEIYARSATEWELRTSGLRPEDRQGNSPQVRIERYPGTDTNCLSIPGCDLADLVFFLSPVQLRRPGLNILIDSLPQNCPEDVPEPFVQARLVSTGNALAAPPDPFRWAVDAHHHYYIPALEAWQEWVLDRRRQTELFIAGTMKIWLDAGKVQPQHFAQQPAAYLAHYREEEADRRRRSERAAAYLSHCLDSPEHLAVEASAMDAGGQDLSYAYQMWAVACERLLESRPGRQLAARLVQGQSRLPAKYVLTDNPPDNEPDFGRSRFGWQAAVAVFTELAPALIKRLRTPSEREAVVRYLERLRGEAPLRGAYEHIYRNLSQGQAPSAGRPRAQRNYTRLLERSGHNGRRTAWAYSAEVQSTATAERLHPNYATFFRALHYPVGAVFESVNLAKAIQAFREANPEQQMRSTVSLVGSSADMASFVAGFVEKVSAHGARMGTRAVRLGNLAGVIGGFCQMFDETLQATEAADHADYGQAVGHAIAASGAGLTAVGSGLVLGESLGYVVAASWPPLAIVIAVGVIMIFGGNMLAAWMHTDAYVRFATTSFLGAEHDAAPHQQRWAQFMIPTTDIRNEAKVLLGIMASFKIYKVGSGDPTASPHSYVDIVAGQIDHRARFYIEMEQQYGGPNGQTFRASLRIDETSDRIAYQSPPEGGLVPRIDSCRIDRHQGENTPNGTVAPGSIQRIRVALRPLSVNVPGQGAMLFDSYGGSHSPPTSCKVRVRLSMGDIWNPPEIGQWVEVDTMRMSGEVDSLDSTKWNT